AAERQDRSLSEVVNAALRTALVQDSLFELPVDEEAEQAAARVEVDLAEQAAADARRRPRGAASNAARSGPTPRHSATAHRCRAAARWYWSRTRPSSSRRTGGCTSCRWWTTTRDTYSACTPTTAGSTRSNSTVPIGRG